MLGLPQETPSRLLRRIKDAEVEFDEMPSLPSFNGDGSNGSVNSDISGMSSVPRRRLQQQRRATSVDDDSVVVDVVGGARTTKTINKQQYQHHRTPIAKPQRSILSPLSGNAARHNGQNSPDSLASLPSDSPKTVDTTSSAGRQIKPGYANAAVSRTISPAHIAQQPPPSATVSSAGSSASTVRHVGHLPAIVAVRKSGRAARTREIVYSDASSDDTSRASSAQISATPAVAQPDASASLFISQSSSQLDLQDLVDDLHQLDDDDDDSRRSEGYSRHEDPSDTPAPRQAARFAPPSPIAEESEVVDDVSQEHLSSLAASPLHSPGLTGHSNASASTTETDLEHIDNAEQHIAQHVVLRRRADDKSAGERPKLVSPASLSTATHISSPGIGRRLPPSAEGKYTPRRASVSPRAVSATPATATSQATTSVAITFNSPTEQSAASTTATPSAAGTSNSLATPRPQYGAADVERRKSHLLSALRLTALRSASKPRLKKGTPHPLRQALRTERQSSAPLETASKHDISDSSRLHATSYAQAAASASRSGSGSGQDSDLEDVTTSSVSSHNLTTHPRGNDNTSLPLAGTGLDTTAAVTRFNGSKLNNYLHALNTHLSEENQNLVKTLEQTTQEVQRLLRKNRELSSAAGSTAETDTEDMTHAGDATSQLLEQHQKTSDDIAAVRQHLVGSAPGSSGTQSRLAESLQKELELARLQLDEREDEIQDLRQQLLQAADEGSDTSAISETRQLQQQKIFDLTDEVASLKLEIAEQDQQLTSAKSANLEAAERHTSAIADMHARTDELLVELQDRDTALEELEERIGQMQDSHVDSMKSLEEELTNVLKGHEDKMRATEERSEQLESQLEEAKTELVRAKEQKNKLEEELAAIQGTAAPEDRSNALMASLTRLRADAAAHDAAKQQMAAAHAQALSEVENRCAELEQDIEALEEDLEAEKIAHSKTSEKLAAAQADVERLNQDLHDAQGQLDTAERELKQVNNKATAKGTTVDADVQTKLDAANREIGNLRYQLASPSRWLDEGKKATLESKDLQIRTLESTNHQLKSRVAQLKRQDTILSPAKSTPEKSVRFDSIHSLQTPLGVTQMLADLSSADGSATEGNQTARPLYTRIDTLQDQIRQLRVMLHSANEDVDDKLHKLGSSGQQAIKLAKQLEVAQKQNRHLEAELQNVSGKNNDAQVLALRRDLEKIKRDAGDLAEDLQAVKNKQRPAAPDFGSDACAKSSCTRLRTQLQTAKDGSRGLLVQIRYLKAKFTRESWFKADLSHQKLYLQRVLQQTESKLAATHTTLARFGMPASVSSSKARPTLRKAAQAVLFTIRARRLAAQWKTEQAKRDDVKDAFLASRGRAL